MKTSARNKIQSRIRQLSGVWSIKHSQLYANFCSLDNIFRYKKSWEQT